MRPPLEGSLLLGASQVGLQDLSPLSAPPRSGKCHNEVVLAPMFERLSTELVQDQLPYSVTHISMPATTEGRRASPCLWRVPV